MMRGWQRLYAPCGANLYSGVVMEFFKRAESAAKRLKRFDYGLVKLAVFAFALFAAKIWPPLLSLDWYWYAAISVLAAIPPIMKALK